jgi:AraC family ethanolamine operon transcriptional activator
VNGQFLPTARDCAPWSISSAQLKRIYTQRVQVGGPAIFAGAGEPNTITVGIPLDEATGIRIDGKEFDDRSFALIKPVQSFVYAARRLTRWAGVTIPLDHPSINADALNSISGGTFATAGSTSDIDGRAVLSQLKMLVQRATQPLSDLALCNEASARAADDEFMSLVNALILSRAPASLRSAGRPGIDRQRVISTVLEVMQAHRTQPLLVSDLSRAVRTSERTLRNVFLEYFCVGPKRLLHAWQLMCVRARLQAEHDAHETVSRIAGEFGVWDLSLFARQYRALFGETPSTTLRSPSKDKLEPDLSWMSCAARTFIAQASAQPGQ